MKSTKPNAKPHNRRPFLQCKSSQPRRSAPQRFHCRANRQAAHGTRMGPTKGYGVHTPTCHGQLITHGVSDHISDHTRLSRRMGEDETAVKVPFVWQLTVNCIGPSAMALSVCPVKHAYGTYLLVQIRKLAVNGLRSEHSETLHTLQHHAPRTQSSQKRTTRQEPHLLYQLNAQNHWWLHVRKGGEMRSKGLARALACAENICRTRLETRIQAGYIQHVKT